MKIKLTYSDVKQALESGFVSPLNSKKLNPAADLVRSLRSFRDAANPRTSAHHINNMLIGSPVIKITNKCPKTRSKQNVFINHVIREVNCRALKAL